MDMPKPTADHQRLERLAGRWRGTEKMYPSPWDPKGGTAEGATDARVALSGFAVIGDYEQRRGGAVTFGGHSVCTWDAHSGEVVMSWWDCMGQGREEFRGKWSGDSLQLTSKSPMGFARLTYMFGKPGSMMSRMEMSPDGQKWATLFDGSYSRVD